ncbi:S-layer homology domain-containing protein [Cytobacillus gottheilii]|uniref:S-layer homology domain-containing protein n=1 Tax=Cytobacillus gottheilii TaxID=859144 RepID=A0ABX8FAW7_9BACI|nr:S-layer homology domain-containing protein [Cytobacillus gottheilii]QVY61309.1 S-layer homology domain-containing protein [Cytobacillus gottheilii]
MKKTASFVLSAAILSGAFAPTYSQAAGTIPFKDIEGSYAKAAILELQEHGILQGNGAGKFNPTGSISREQFAIVLANALKLNLEEAPATPSFSDIPASHYAYKHIEAVKKAGIALGYKDGTFNGTEKLNREQMAVLYVRALGKDVDGYDAKLPFSDKGMISAFARDAVGYATEIGLINGYSNGTFGPNNFATREAVAKVTLPFIKVVENLKPVKPEPTPDPEPVPVPEQPKPEQPEVDPEPELPEIDPQPEVPEIPGIDPMPEEPTLDQKVENLSLILNAFAEEKDSKYDGWGTTITAKTFNNVGMQGVTDENFDLVLGLLAATLYQYEEKDPNFQMILGSKEYSEMFINEFMYLMAKEDLIQDFKAKLDYINTSLRTQHWEEFDGLIVAPEVRTVLEAEYKGVDLTPLEINEIMFANIINEIDNEEVTPPVNEEVPVSNEEVPAEIQTQPITDFSINGYKGEGYLTFRFSHAAGASSMKVLQSIDGGQTWTDSVVVSVYDGPNGNYIGTSTLTETNTGVRVSELTAGTYYEFKIVVTGGEHAGDSNIISTIY